MGGGGSLKTSRFFFAKNLISWFNECQVLKNMFTKQKNRVKRLTLSFVHHFWSKSVYILTFVTGKIKLGQIKNLFSRGRCRLPPPRRTVLIRCRFILFQIYLFINVFPHILHHFPFLVKVEKVNCTVEEYLTHNHS